MDSPTAAQNAIRQLLALTQRVLNGQCTAASYLDSRTGAFEVLAVVGLSAEIEQRLWRDLSYRTMSDYFLPDVLDRLKAEEMVTFNFALEPPIPGQDYYGLSNVLFVPTRLDSRRLLVVGVEVHDRAIFTPQERALAQAAARLVRLVVERERLTREREEARARELAAVEARRQMDEFLGIASHELRTPLTSVIANVQMGLREAETLRDAAISASTSLGGRLDRQRLLLERTDRQLHRLDRLIGDLLDVSRISAGKLEMRSERCDLVGIVREVVEAQRAAWPERRITLAVPKGGSVNLVVDPDRLGQVVANILSNALKYSATDQPVEVSVRVRDGSVRIAARDHGPGLSVEQQAHVFERFHRVPGIEQQSGSGIGLGLGLYICKTIVERHGGTIGVESAPGAGSIFSFVLPLNG